MKMKQRKREQQVLSKPHKSRAAQVCSGKACHKAEGWQGKAQVGGKGTENTV
ncbi:MAG: hypothetical protein KKF77_08555 [Proteobacteria bacterium]|nr:hypothetical protein [Pseudomonadota bacterium]